jgi:hypothetical protein
MTIAITSEFLANNYVEKGFSTSTTTTEKTPNNNPNQKYNLKHNYLKALDAFLFNYNNQRRKKTSLQ